MRSRRSLTIAAVLALVAGAAAAAILLNLALLGYAQPRNDPVGKLSPRAVLTGGACANLYSGGAYQSMDADFILSGSPALEDLNHALNALGFRRRGDRYVHPRVPFFVEFPRGPLGIGQDVQIRAVWRVRRGAKTLALSATDSCGIASPPSTIGATSRALPPRWRSP